ncbi:MAG: addiction module component [Verrucomicrobia bacterium]|nr:MAG: addiction module component [Verrucomicrobiota bacterium]
MAAAVERLAQEALSLSDQERAELARKLLVSLEGPPEEGVEAAWDVEIAKRVDRIGEGTAKGRPAEEVSRDIRARHE